MQLHIITCLSAIVHMADISLLFTLLTDGGSGDLPLEAVYPEVHVVTDYELSNAFPDRSGLLDYLGLFFASVSF